MTLLSRLSLGCLVTVVAASAQVVIDPARPFPGSGSYGPGVKVYAAQFGRGGSYLGVHLIEVDEARAGELNMPVPSGVEITSVAESSPADQGGIVSGDVILEFRNEKVAGVEHFMRLVRETPVDRAVAIVVWRNGSEQTLRVRIGKRTKTVIVSPRMDCEDEEDCHGYSFDFSMPNLDIHIPMPQMVLTLRVLGAQLEAVKSQLGEYFGVEEGVLVREVASNSPAARAELQAGDVIISVDGETVRTPRQVQSAIQSADEDDVSIEVMRNRSTKTLRIEASRAGGSWRPNRRRGRAVQTRRL